MIKYIVTRDKEMDENYYMTDIIGIYDTEEEASTKAEDYFNNLSDEDKHIFEINVGVVSEDSLEEEGNWETYTEIDIIEFYIE